MTDQSSKWHQTRKARMDELFTGKKYDVLKEFSSDKPVETPLGYKINKGFVLESVKDSEIIYVGKALLNQLADEYSAVEKPEPKRRGRPRKQPLEQAEQWADRDMPDDAQQITQAGPTYVNPNQNESA